MAKTRVEQKGNVLSVWVDDVSSGWQKWILLRSDAHHDSVYCRRDVELKHLKLAQERNAWIIDAGDLFDAMQGKFDPRRSMEELRPEYRVSHYYDAILEDAVGFYEPFAENFLLIGRGNHETAVIKNVGIDITDRLVYELNRKKKNDDCATFSGGFGGWVRFMFSISGHRTSILLKYYHGNGNTAPVTKGVIDTNRQAVYLPDADVVLNGHNHNAYWLPLARERLSNKGIPYSDLVHFVRTPGYKSAWDAKYGFDVERNPAPRPIGAVWMQIVYEHKKFHLKFTPDVE